MSILKPLHRLGSFVVRVVYVFMVFIIVASILTLQPFLKPKAHADSIFTAGPRTATATGDCVNTATIGTVAWTSPGNAFSTNTTYATASVDGTTSNYISCTNFGFTISAGSTINGIVVSVNRKSNSTSNGGSQDAAVRTIKGGVIGSTDKSTTTLYTTSDVNENHGTSTELWGNTWTYSDINASTFGAAFAATKLSAAGAAHTVSVDDISITVYYTTLSSLEQSSYRWFDSAVSIAPLNGVAQNTATNAPNEGTGFRLRLMLHVTLDTLHVSDRVFKLQYATKFGTCDTAFSGETYADVGTTTPISYYDNTSLTDASSISSSGNDPTHSSDTIVYQEYQESGNFGVATNIAIAQDGLWDISLVDNGAPASTTYCFRVVTSASSLIDTYTVIPEITTGTGRFEQSGYQLFNNQDASSTSTYLETVGNTGSDRLDDITYDSFGNMYTVGYTDSYGAGSADIMVNKFNSSGMLVWSKTWGDSSNQYGYGIKTSASGDIYVTGYTTVSSVLYVALIKMNTMGVEQWSKRLPLTNSRGLDMIMDSSDNIYVTGDYLTGGAGTGNIILSKYNSSGVEQWTNSWNGASDDTGYALISDGSGNLYIAGATNSNGAGSYDALLTKFNSSGVEQWSKTWGGANSDSGYGLTIDGSGNLYLAGSTASFGTATDAFLSKFDSSGIEQWSKTWGGASADTGYDVTIDGSGNLYMAGSTASYGTATDAFLAKFNSSGVEQWSKTWGGTNSDIANGITFDSKNNLYVIGQTLSYGRFNTEGYAARFDASGDILNCTGCATQTITEGNITVTEGTVTITETTQTVTEVDLSISEADTNMMDTRVLGGTVGGYTTGWGSNAYGYGSVLDSSGNIYVVGMTLVGGAGAQDVMLIKFNSSGVKQWAKAWGGTGADYGYDVTIDGSGNLYVTGSTASYGAGSDDMMLIKFNSSGVEQWSKTWGGTGSDIGNAVTIDGSGNLYVTGSTTTFGSNTDLILVKFNSSGVEQWSKTWGGTGTDIGFGVTMDGSNNLYVTGRTSSYGLGSTDAVLIKFNSSGVEQWSKTWGGTINDSSSHAVLDASGNIFVASTIYLIEDSKTVAALVKFNSSGVIQWTRVWEGSATDITKDSSDNLYVTGLTSSFYDTSNDNFIIKFSSSGVEQWLRTYGEQTSNSSASSIELDSSNNIYVAGYELAFRLTLTKIDNNGWGCGGFCKTVNSNHASLTITETDQAVTEADQTITEADQTVTEADQAVTELNINSTPLPQQLGIGTTLNGVGQNTATTLSSTSSVFRIRTLLHNLSSSKKVATNSLSLKLQFSPRVGSCDTSFSGENYTDVTSTSTYLKYYSNTIALGGLYLTTSANDPTHNSDTKLLQTYAEGNYFYNRENIMPGFDSMWDFALSPNGTTQGGVYCLRIVNSDNSLLNTYSYVMEIGTPPDTSQLMRHGKYFDPSGYKQAMYW